LGFFDESEVASIPEARVVRENLPMASVIAPKALFWNTVPEAATFHTQTPLPVSEPPAPRPLLFVPQPPDQDDLVTMESLKKIHAVAHAIRDKLPAEWREEMKVRFNVESAKALTERQAGIILGELEMVQNGA
jgi:predicted secreted protein